MAYQGVTDAVFAQRLEILLGVIDHTIMMSPRIGTNETSSHQPLLSMSCRRRTPTASVGMSRPNNRMKYSTGEMNRLPRTARK